MSPRPRSFTFVEILIALALLGLALALAFTSIGMARDKLLRAERRWARQHVLNQATEFFLVAGPKASPPDGVLPEGFAASCEAQDAVDLPDNAAAAVDGWMLTRLHVTVRGPGGQVVAEQVVEKVVRSDGN